MVENIDRVLAGKLIFSRFVDNKVNYFPSWYTKMKYVEIPSWIVNSFLLGNYHPPFDYGSLNLH